MFYASFFEGILLLFIFLLALALELPPTCDFIFLIIAIPLFCKYLYITSMCCIDACLYFFPAYRAQILCCCFSSFGCLEDKPEIDDGIFFRLFACFRWLRVSERGKCVACRVSHFIELPCQTFFCLFFVFFCKFAFGDLALCSR